MSIKIEEDSFAAAAAASWQKLLAILFRWIHTWAGANISIGGVRLELHLND